jgi:hypothetical protein
MSNVYSTTGVGIGYAYMMDDNHNTALTLVLGHAGDETAVRGSVGFEFGGSKRPNYVLYTECSYVKGELTLEQKCKE